MTHDSSASFVPSPKARSARNTRGFPSSTASKPFILLTALISFIVNLGNFAEVTALTMKVFPKTEPAAAQGNQPLTDPAARPRNLPKEKIRVILLKPLTSLPRNVKVARYPRWRPPADPSTRLLLDYPAPADTHDDVQCS